MKVLMIYKTEYGGVAVHINEVAKELRKLGIQVDMISRNETLGINSFKDSLIKLVKYFRTASTEYDIIHTHDWSVTYPAIISGIKNHVATFHGFPTGVFASIIQSYCIDVLGKKAVVVSPKMKEKYKTSTMIPNGINTNLFKPNKKITREKNLVGLAYKYEYDPTEIISILKEANLPYKIAMNIPYNRMPNFYSSLRIFISIPPKITGFNMTYLEAMACRVPFIIGTEDGIGAELPILKISNLEQLKTILFRIRNNEIYPKNYSIPKQFNWKENAKELKKLYES